MNYGRPHGSNDTAWMYERLYGVLRSAPETYNQRIRIQVDGADVFVKDAVVVVRDGEPPFLRLETSNE